MGHPTYAGICPVVLLLLLIAHPSIAATGPVVGAQSIPFNAKDVNGQTWMPSVARGRKIAMFFFCGCDACHRLARQWATLQRTGVVAQSARPGSMAPLTVEVFSGDAQSELLFASQTRQVSDVLLITDPNMKVTDLYQAEPCPRVFVIDRNGIIRYTNNSCDDAPQKHDEVRIAYKALQALRIAD